MKVFCSVAAAFIGSALAGKASFAGVDQDFDDLELRLLSSNASSNATSNATTTTTTTTTTATNATSNTTTSTAALNVTTNTTTTTKAQAATCGCEKTDTEKGDGAFCNHDEEDDDDDSASSEGEGGDNNEGENSRKLRSKSNWKVKSRKLEESSASCEPCSEVMDRSCAEMADQGLPELGVASCKKYCVNAPTTPQLNHTGYLVIVEVKFEFAVAEKMTADAVAGLLDNADREAKLVKSYETAMSLAPGSVNYKFEEAEGVVPASRRRSRKLSANTTSSNTTSTTAASSNTGNNKFSNFRVTESFFSVFLTKDVADKFETKASASKDAMTKVFTDNAPADLNISGDVTASLKVTQHKIKLSEKEHNKVKADEAATQTTTTTAAAAAAATATTTAATSGASTVYSGFAVLTAAVMAAFVF